MPGGWGTFGTGKKLIAAGDWEVCAALTALLRWGWKPSDFVRLSAPERAFVIAGLQKELAFFNLN